jgi:hypothetical protein
MASPHVLVGIQPVIVIAGRVRTYPVILKFEIRSTKSETNPNYQNQNHSDAAPRLPSFGI